MATNSPRIVNFNVGGVKYSTYISTITNFSREENTLSILINQENEKRLIENGHEVFIDRNGSLFEHVLDFMRNKNMGMETILPEDKFVLRRLLAEAKYYQLADLEALISIDLESPTTNQSTKYRVGDYVKFLHNVSADVLQCGHGRASETSNEAMKEMRTYLLRAMGDGPKYRKLDQWAGKVKKVIDRCVIAEFTTTLMQTVNRDINNISHVLHLPEAALEPM